MEKPNKFQPQDNSSSEFIEVLLDYLSHWKLFLISTFICLFIGVVIYLTTERKYNVSSSVLLKENQSSNSSLGSLEDLGLISTTNNVDNEISVFKSPDLMRQVVQSLEIQTSYFVDSRFRRKDVYKDCPYYIRLEDISAQEFSDNIEFTIKKEGAVAYLEGVYISYEGAGEIPFKGEVNKLPGLFELPNKLGRLYVSEVDGKKADDKTYFIRIQSIEDVAMNLSSTLQISSATKSSSVLNVNTIVPNELKGRDILSELVKKYNEDNVRENNQTAFNTSVFINERLKDIAVELGSVEKDVESYKQTQGITDLSSETQLYMQQTGRNEQRKLDIETQLNVINLVESYIRKGENKNKPIPNLGINDPGLVESITDYNSRLLEFQRLVASAGEDNPSRKRFQSELETAHASISDAVSNVKRAMTLNKREIDQQNAETTARIHSIPKQERGLLEKMRQQQIKENLYLFLLQKREETNITMASTSDKAKIVVAPRSKGKVAPAGKKILLGFFVLGIALSALIIYVRNLFRVSISSRAELEKLSEVPVIGQISNNEGGESIVVHKDETTAIVELFRSLRNNIGFTFNSSKGKKVVMVTSTVSGEGKTFISTNLSLSFALNNKKVLLIGMDIRNPQLAKTFKLPVAKGLTSYLSEDIRDWRDLIMPYKENPNLHIIQAGIIPPNPNELLMNPLVSTLIEEAKTEYDIVILDTAPVGIISDTYLLSKYPDLTLYVVRERVTHKESIAFINDQREQNKLSNIYLILNDVHKKNESYRYGYGQTYGYTSKDKKK